MSFFLLCSRERAKVNPKEDINTPPQADTTKKTDIRKNIAMPSLNFRKRAGEIERTREGERVGDDEGDFKKWHIPGLQLQSAQ